MVPPESRAARSASCVPCAGARRKRNASHARRAKYERGCCRAMLVFLDGDARGSRLVASSRRASDLVAPDACCLATILRHVDLEIGEESWRLALEETEERHRQTANLQLRALARAKL